MTLRELKCLIEAEKEKEKVSDEVIKAAAALLKVNCSKTQYCSLECCFWNDSEGCSIYNWPEYWEV